MATQTAVLTLRLSHYRSWLGALVDTGGGSVALYGPNGAGKTNILEAVSMLSPGRGLRRAGSVELVRRPEALGWKISAEIDCPDGEVEVSTAAEGAEAARRSVVIDDAPAPQLALGRLLRIIWLTPVMDRLWTETAGERRRFLDRICLGFEPGHGEVSLSYEKAMRGRNRLLKEPGWDDAWMAGLEAQMARSGARIARVRAETLERLSQAQNQGDSGPKSLFPKADLAILGDMEARFHRVIRDSSAPDEDLDLLEIEEAAGLARRLAEGRVRDGAAGRTLEGPHRSDLEAIYAIKSMPARACSTGEQKALLISLCLANARALALATGATPVVLLDEVAAHLDAERRRALYSEIEALGCQAWMTGTGPELFDGSAALRFEVTEQDGASALRAA